MKQNTRHTIYQKQLGIEAQYKHLIIQVNSKTQYTKTNPYLNPFLKNEILVITFKIKQRRF